MERNEKHLSSGFEVEDEHSLKALLLEGKDRLVPAIESSIGSIDQNRDLFLLIHAHCLPSFEVLLDALVDGFQFDPSKVFLVTKSYSAIPSVARSLRKKSINVFEAPVRFSPGKYDDSQYRFLRDACENLLKYTNQQSNDARVIVLDDGGIITTVWDSIGGPDNVETVSIQLTSSGVHRDPKNVVKIDMARSAAKRIFESKIIAEAVIRKIEQLDSKLLQKKVGIAGVGAIGSALAKRLKQRDVGAHLVALENGGAPRIPEILNWQYEPDQFLKRIEVVFGCTGANWTKNIEDRKLLAGKTFVSCSSRDIEFKHVLEKFTASALLQNKTSSELRSIKDIVIWTNPNSIVLNGGFPINFDRKSEWESFSEIALTRLLLLGSVIMASAIKIEKVDLDYTVKLPPEMQMVMVDDWLRVTSSDFSDFGIHASEASNPTWWWARSGGADYKY